MPESVPFPRKFRKAASLIDADKPEAHEVRSMVKYAFPEGMPEPLQKVIPEIAEAMGVPWQDLCKLWEGRRVLDRTVAVRRCPDCSADLAIVGDGNRADLVFLRHNC